MRKSPGSIRCNLERGAERLHLFHKPFWIFQVHRMSHTYRNNPLSLSSYAQLHLLSNRAKFAIQPTGKQEDRDGQFWQLLVQGGLCAGADAAQAVCKALRVIVEALLMQCGLFVWR